MITVSFKTHDEKVVEATVSGHADFAEYGQDIVCAAVTSALELTANAITHVLGVPAHIVQESNKVSITLPKDAPLAALQYLEAFHLHLSGLAEDYPENIKLIHTEV